ncbi:hypothetical protein [Planococcus halocryophilus]|uniref:hypothetical protein n=1 Tax=Planococcus halocryophilus TaxID=1215089 RepID=UPI001F103824|nr:hypothetical protein [Planococcus halocryophilus]MCH4826345.1 hypothetical protein [Planococcus halocryophilus]
MNKKFSLLIASSALSIGVVGSAVGPVFASETTEALTENATEQSATAVSKDKEERRSPFADLDDETKDQAKAILDELQDDAITKEEAQTQLQALGIELPEMGELQGKGNRHGNPFADLDEETQTQAKAIMDELKDGTLTKEEAQTQLQALGIELPEMGERQGKGNRHGNPFADLDEETQTQAKAIMDELKDGTLTNEEAQAQLEALGIEAPELKGDRFADLDEETRTQVEAILDQVKEGTLTKEEAQTQLEAFDVELPKQRGGAKKHRGERDNTADENSDEGL